MLKESIRLVILTSLWLTYPKIGLTVEHPPGHGSSGSGSAGCQKVGIRNMKPAALSEVAAGSEFSAIVFGANFPEDIEVTAKKIPVAATVAIKDDFFLVTGKLPADLHSTAARVNIKIKGKVANCTEENGWLLKITN
ncbi:MAG: hypothetical protein HOP02_06355 [Methylococcaceae bacterium]|nr:hypothetical protein [Methylococcaceae bacterium]